PVLGICNGFQVLCEAGLLPGALTRNEGLLFLCRDQWLRVESNSTAWTTRYDAGAEILVPLKSGEGRYQAPADVLERLEGDGRVVFRYVGDNPNGSQNAIAGISSENGRVVGLMPHPEHATEALTGPSDDGLGMFLSVLDGVLAGACAPGVPPCPACPARRRPLLVEGHGCLVRVHREGERLGQVQLDVLGVVRGVPDRQVL